MNKIELRGKTILVTGGAGFIGSNLIYELLKSVEPVKIVSMDNLNDYYDVSIKNWRLNRLEKEAGKHRSSSYVFVRGELGDKETVDGLFSVYHPQIVVNLAAQAGVRYSITNPQAYIESNLIGFYNILEA